MEIVLNEYGLALLLGVVTFVTFWVINFFTYSLAPTTYDDALAKLNKKEKEQKSPKKKSARKGANLHIKTPKTAQGDSDPEGTTSNENSPHKQNRKRKNSQQQKFKRAESLKNEHVIFADEISPEDEKFSPKLNEECGDMIEGILHNKEEVPIVDKDLVNGEEEEDIPGKSLNTFEEIHPLDDLQLIRRKSLQMTPSGSNSGSRANSNRGSRTDLSNIGNLSMDEEPEEGRIRDGRRVLTFSTEIKSQEPESPKSEEFMTVNKICKIIRKMEMSESEMNSIMELMVKKEESSEWKDSNKAKGGSIMSALKKDLEEKQEQVNQSKELVTSLQSKLKQLRQEFTEEKSLLVREKRETEEANERLRNQLRAKSGEDDLLKKEVERLKTRVESVPSQEGLSERLKAEEEENKKMDITIRELQVVVNAALKKIYPSMEIGGYCEEHEKALDRFVSNMKDKGRGEMID